MAEKELAAANALVFEEDAQINSLNQAQAKMNQTLLCHHLEKNPLFSELQWVVKEGLPSFVRGVLNSGKFGDANAALQMATI